MIDDKRNKLERAFASLQRRLRGEDQKPAEYFKPLPILHSAFESKHMDSRSWVRPHGPRRDRYY
jgi:hypothetical protein